LTYSLFPLCFLFSNVEELTAEDAEKTQSKQRKILTCPLFPLWFLYLFLIANEINHRGCGEDTEQAEENISFFFVLSVFPLFFSVVSVFVFNR